MPPPVRDCARPRSPTSTGARSQIRCGPRFIPDRAERRMSGRYRDNPQALARLVPSPTCTATSTSTPRCSSSRWSTSCQAPGSTSATPARCRTPGDFITADIAGQAADHGAPHRRHGARADEPLRAQGHEASSATPAGNTGKSFRCPYHAWTYRTDGSLLNIPLKNGYDGTGSALRGGAGLTPVKNVQPYRGFVFARLNESAPASRTTSATRSPRSTTWPTARPKASSRSPAAACASCTTATGRCSSRT